jgi:outer membrane protein OmpA-like peptidoglycan-associated protein/WD40 repeat protein/Mg-chelatase subunit ChlD
MIFWVKIKATVLNSIWFFKEIIAVIFLLTIVSEKITKCQTIKFNYINDMNYPEMEASFVATYSNGEKNFTLKEKDFKISENTENTQVIKVINPDREGSPVSVVLMFDISSSMKNERIDLAKEAAMGFLKNFPLETSEIAIASFSDDVSINCDFTQDFNRLKDAINNLAPDGGTNYSKAFMQNATGAIDIVKNGKYKKNIVFLTDGQSHTNALSVINQAQHEGITIYCISMALEMPQVLKDIATLTGGKYYEAVTNIYQLHNFYASIGQLLQTSGYSIIRWRALPGCERIRNVKINALGQTFNLVYDIPNYKLGFLQPDPAMLFFKGNDSLNANQTISLTAKNQPIKITEISNIKKNYFSVTDSLQFPLVVNKDERINFTLHYRNPEAGVISDKLNIMTEGCPPLRLDLNGGQEEQLKIISPKGKEIFPVGIDTLIAWEGIKRNKNVTLWYRTNPLNPWKFIEEANNLQYSWKVPIDTGMHVQIKAEPSLTDSRDYRIENKLITHMEISDFCLNANGTLVLTVDKTGMVTLYNATTGKIMMSVGGYNIKYALLSPDSKKIIGFNGPEMFVWDVTTFKLVARFTLRQKLLLSNTGADGEQTLFYTRTFKDLDNKTKVWSPASNVNIPIPAKPDNSSSDTTSSVLTAIMVDNENNLRLWNQIDNQDITQFRIKQEASVIVNPTGTLFAIAEKYKVKIYDFKSGKEQFTLDPGIFKKFSSNGNIVVTSDGINVLNFWDAQNGNPLFYLKHPTFYHLAYKTDDIVYLNNDTLFFKNLRNSSPYFKIIDPQALDAIISPDSKTLAVIHKNNTVDFYDIYEQKKINTLYDFDKPIIRARFSEDGKTFSTALEDGTVLLLKPYVNKKLKEAFSEEFAIVAPKPVVKDSILFGDVELNNNKEIIVEKYISNPGTFPVYISAIKLDSTTQVNYHTVSDFRPVVLQPGGQIPVELGYIPVKPGKSEGFMYVYTPTGSFKTILSGNGMKPQIECISENINFGKIKVFSRKDSLVAVIKNTGEKTVFISDILMDKEPAGIFSLNENTWVNELKPGETLSLSLNFSPRERGRISGRLIIKTVNNPTGYKISLTGEGVASRELWVVGKTINSSNNKPVSAMVNGIDLISGQRIYRLETDASGVFRFKLNADRDYGLTAEKERFISGSENINLTQITFKDTIYRDIYLTEIKTGAIIRMNCIFFEFAKWNLLSESKAELDNLTGILLKYPEISIEIHGHTDSIGSNESNMRLSYNRAAAVKDYLVKKGIKASRLFVFSFGENIPVTSNSSEEGRARNRRVEVKVR